MANHSKAGAGRRRGRGLPRHTTRQPPIAAALAMWLTIAASALWGATGPVWGLVGAGILVAAVAVPVAGRTGYRWLLLGWAHRRRRWETAEPVTAINDRQPGGVRYQDGVAITAVRLLGKYLTKTELTGAATSETDNVLHTDDLANLLHQQLDLTIASISIVIHGARMRAEGDFTRLCDTFIGPPPYAGQREAWLIMRIDTALGNLDAVTVRNDVAETAVAATQRAINALRTKGIRAEIATETDIINLDERLAALTPSTYTTGMGWQCGQTGVGCQASTTRPSTSTTPISVWCGSDAMTQ